MDFTQSAPVAGNRFRTDKALRLHLERLLPPEILAEAAPLLDQMGQLATDTLPHLADRAELNPPRLIPFDPWGNRIDRIDIDPAWLRLVAIGQELGLVAIPYEGRFGAYGRIVQAGLMQLFDPVSATAACPLAMTDGAAWLLQKHDAALAERYLPRLLARENGWTSGQWMTEREGGSDVGRSSTVATPAEDGRFRLHGVKWFTSATSADIALALARPEGAEPGSRGLSLFLLELRRENGDWNGIRVRRLKEKMGTRALPTAELELDGALAVPVGGLGRGVAKVASLLNVARLWAGAAAPAGVGHLLALARDYAGKREVFGRRLRDQPSHVAWLADIAARYEGMLAMVMETAAVVGRAEHGGNASLARLMAPLTKLLCARQGISAGSELLESFGGAGYVEDTGLPRVFRNLHVHAIWEGTTNVLAHDVVRALSSGDLGAEWLEDMRRRLSHITVPELQAARDRVTAAIDAVCGGVRAPGESGARGLALGMARITQAVLLCEAAAWRAETKRDRAGVIACELLTRAPLYSADADPPAALHDLALGT
jgi:alkylation response protein AidB-like acyl-CoA dehydrogenase